MTGVTKASQPSVKQGETGTIPSDWKYGRLADFCERPQYGYTNSGIDRQIDGPRFLRITDITNNGVNWASVPFCQIDKDKEAEYTLKDGDILVARIGATTGKSFLILNPPRAAFGSYLIRIRTKDGLLPQFLGFYMQTRFYWDYIEISRGGRLKQGINIPVLNNLPIPVPPIGEQEQIVNVLSAIQQAQQATRELINISRELKISVSAHYFSNIVTAASDEDSQTENVTRRILPKGWKIEKLGRLVKILDSKRVPLSENERQNMKGIYPYCGANGVIDWIDRFIFDGEYLLLAEDGGYWDQFDNSTYLMKEKFWVNNHAHILSAIPSLALNSYLMHVLNYMNLKPYITGTTRGKLTQGDMIKIPVPTPSLSEQKEIAKALNCVDEKITSENAWLSALQVFYQTVLQQLMSGQCRIPVIRS